MYFWVSVADILRVNGPLFKAQLVLKTLRIRPFHKISEIELGYIVYNKMNSSIGEDTTIN